jgi:UDP-N-acetyl-2-amino-2-deoxyglucuronate dehydrogenase
MYLFFPGKPLGCFCDGGAVFTSKDMLSWVFGDLKQNTVHVHAHDRASGYLEFEKARVRWFQSINYDVLPNEIKAKSQRSFRSITIEGEELESSGGLQIYTLRFMKIFWP